MDQVLKDLLYSRYPEPRAERFEKTHELLEQYGYTRHNEPIEELLNSPDVDDIDYFDLSYLSTMTNALEEILTLMYLQLNTNSFNQLYSLLDGIYLLENYLDTDVVLHYIESKGEEETNEDLLTTMLVNLAGMEWGETRAMLYRVPDMFIKTLQAKCLEVKESDANAVAEPNIMRRKEGIKAFFEQYPDSVVYGYIKNQLLTVPTTKDVAVTTMSKALFTLQEPAQIAIELCAMSYVMSITEQSIPKMAKILANELYSDIGFVTGLNHEIDKVMRSVAGKGVTRAY